MREQHRGIDLVSSITDEHTLADREARTRATAARDDAASLLLDVVSSSPRDPRGILERRQISAGRVRRGATARSTAARNRR